MPRYLYLKNASAMLVEIFKATGYQIIRIAIDILCLLYSCITEYMMLLFVYHTLYEFLGLSKFDIVAYVVYF